MTLARSAIDEILSRSRAGDRNALESLARWCLPRVRRTVMVACGGGPESDDIVQNTMAIVLTRLDTFRGEASFYVWVDRITINEIRGSWRKRSSWLRRLGAYRADPSMGRAVEGDLPVDQLARARLMERTLVHVRTLKPTHRLPVVLNLLHGYTGPEVAAMLGVGLEAAKKRLQRGRRELEAALKRDPACADYFNGGLR